MQNRLLEKVFEKRGYTDEYLRNINSVSKDKLKDIDKLSNRLKNIYDNQYKLVVLGDFDMDGICASVIGLSGFSELGFNVGLYAPTISRGYGFREQDILDLINQFPDVHTIITCDVGIDCHEGIRIAKEKGIDIIITDHHIQKSICNADVVVNPMRLDETYEHPHICGATVLYNCLMDYTDTYCTQYTKEQISRLRVFAGLGTISDSMPLLYDNRELVTDAVDILRLVYSYGNDFIVSNIQGCDLYRRTFYGLHHILKVFADMGKLQNRHSISEDFVGFYLAPMFNSIKRMSGDITKAFDVFFGNNLDIVYASINYLIDLNEERKQAVITHLDYIDNTHQPYSPYIYLCNADSGLLGLLAQQLIKRSGTPTLVLNTANGIHGSGRSPSWYPFLDKISHLDFCWAAGHNPAFGFGCDSEASLQKYVDFIKQDIKATTDSMKLSSVHTDDAYDFTIGYEYDDVDTDIDILLFVDYLHCLRRYKPFGSHFPVPTSLLKFRTEDAIFKTIGSNGQHLKIILPRNFAIYLWNESEKLELFKSAVELQAIGRLDDFKTDNYYEVSFKADDIVISV